MKLGEQVTTRITRMCLKEMEYQPLDMRVAWRRNLPLVLGIVLGAILPISAMHRLLAVLVVLASMTHAGQSSAQMTANSVLKGQRDDYVVPGELIEEPFFERWLRFGKRQLNGFDDSSSQVLLRIPVERLSKHSSVTLEKGRYPVGTVFVLISADKDYEAIRDDGSWRVLEHLRKHSFVEFDENTKLYKIYSANEADHYVANFDPRIGRLSSDEDFVAHCLNIGNAERYSASCQYSFVFDGMAIDMKISAAELPKAQHYESAMRLILSSWRIQPSVQER